MSKEKLSIDSGIFEDMRGQIDAALTAANCSKCGAKMDGKIKKG